MSSPDAPELQEPTAEVPETSPDAAPAPVAEAEPGQTDLPPETPPQGDADEAQPDGDSQDPPTDTAPAGETTPVEWSKLSPSERKAAGELLKQLQPGEIPRIAKLVARNHQAEQVIEAQQKEIDELRTQAETPQVVPVNQSQPLPPTVAKLKTVAEVTARTGEMQSAVEMVTDLLDEFPNGNSDQSDTWQLGDKTFTRSQLVQSRRNCQEELKALRVRSTDLQHATQFQAARAQATAAIHKDYPQLDDPANPDTVVARDLLAKDVRLQSDVNGEYLALALATGHRLLQDQKTKRLQPAAARAVRPAATVPAGKPHAAGSPAATRGAGGTTSALEAHRSKGNRESFAALLSARG